MRSMKSVRIMISGSNFRADKKTLGVFFLSVPTLMDRVTRYLLVVGGSRYFVD